MKFMLYNNIWTSPLGKILSIFALFWFCQHDFHADQPGRRGVNRRTLMFFLSIHCLTRMSNEIISRSFRRMRIRIEVRITLASFGPGRVLWSVQIAVWWLLNEPDIV